MKRVAILAFTRNGAKLSENISCIKSELYIYKAFVWEKYAGEIIDAEAFDNTENLLNRIFDCYDFIIFISSTGIAVRHIDGRLKGKERDPGIIVVDSSGKFVISLVSGHIGGANEFCRHISIGINAIPVITTASDNANMFSPDIFAVKNNLHITNLVTAKKIAAAILEGKSIGIVNNTSVKLDYMPDMLCISNESEYGIVILDNENDKFQSPFLTTLVLIRKDVIIGVGCKKNTDSSVFENEVNKYLKEYNIDITRICAIHSIDLKKDENAIWHYSRKYRVPVEFFSKSELKNVDGNFTGSDFVKSITGVDNVCERSAVVNGGKLFVEKQSGNGITFAAAKI